MKKLKFYLVGILAAASMTSCLLDDEVDAYTQNMDDIVGFDTSSTTVSYFEDEGVVTNYYPISLKGSATDLPSDEDITISVSVDAANSDAVLGTEYDFSTTELTMEAGSDYVLLPIDIHTGSFNTTEPTTLVINITTETEGAVVAANYSSLTIQFVGCISTILEGDYIATIGAQSSIGGGNSYYETITSVGVNQFITLETPPYFSNLNPGLSAYGFIFEDVCGTISVAEQGLFNNSYASYPVVGVPTTDAILTNQQGAIIEGTDNFVVNISVNGYIEYITYTKI